MGLLDRIKSALGLTSASTSRPAPTATDGPSPAEDVSANGPSSDEGRESDGVDVTVEHEPSTDSEDAVKGTDTAASAEAESATVAEPTAETGSDTEAEPTAETESATEAEPESADGAEPATGAESPSATERTTGSDSATTGETDREGDSDVESGSTADLEDVKGIGPTYAERLREAGVAGVGDLAAADAADLADRTDIAQSRVENWVERAEDY